MVCCWGMVTLELFISAGGFFGYRHEYSSVIDKLINGIPLTGWGKSLWHSSVIPPGWGYCHPLGGGIVIPGWGYFCPPSVGVFEPTVSQLLMNSFPYLGHHNFHFWWRNIQAIPQNCFLIEHFTMLCSQICHFCFSNPMLPQRNHPTFW